MSGALPVLIVTPHSSGHVPFDVLAEMLGEEAFSSEVRAQRLEELFLEGDPYTDAIFHAPGATSLHAPVSRFVVDLNRDRDTVGENGVIKRTDFERRPLYPPGFELDAVAHEERLRRYWDSFHAEIERCLKTHPIRLIINGHSMQPYGPQIGPDAGQPRPALTLMTASGAAGWATDTLAFQTT